jgi:hypothetical protein
VFHDDRELEFILVKRWIETLYGNGTLQLDNQSCEMIAQSLISAIGSQYGAHREVVVDVSEDNENGAVVTQSPVEYHIC